MNSAYRILQRAIQRVGERGRDACEGQPALRRRDQACPPYRVLDRHRVGFLEEQWHPGLELAPPRTRCVVVVGAIPSWRATNRSVATWAEARMPPSAPWASIV